MVRNGRGRRLGVVACVLLIVGVSWLGGFWPNFEMEVSDSVVEDSILDTDTEDVDSIRHGGIGQTEAAQEGRLAIKGSVWRGLVVDEFGSPLMGAAVAAYAQDPLVLNSLKGKDRKLLGRSTTDVKGGFEIEQPMEVDVAGTLSAEMAGYERDWLANVAGESPSKLILKRSEIQEFRVHVYSASGVPIAHASVRLGDPGEPVRGLRMWTGSTNSLGVAAFRDLPMRRARIVVESGFHVQILREQDLACRDVFVTLESLTAVTGHVVDAVTGNGIAGAVIDLSHRRYATSGPDGRFHLQVPLIGDGRTGLTFDVSREGYVSRLLSIPSLPAAEASGTREHRIGSVALGRGVTIRGHRPEAKEGKLSLKARQILDGGRRGDWRSGANIDKHGGFEFVDVPSNAWIVVEGQRLGQAWATPIVIVRTGAPGSVAEIGAVSGKSFIVECQVVDTAVRVRRMVCRWRLATRPLVLGLKAGSVPVEFQPPGARLSGEVACDSEGRFRLVGIPPGELTLNVVASGAVIASKRSIIEKDMALEIPASPALGIDGRVSAADGSAVGPSVVVAVGQRGGPRSRHRGIVTRDGRFRLSGLPPGLFDLHCLSVSGSREDLDFGGVKAEGVRAGSGSAVLLEVPIVSETITGFVSPETVRDEELPYMVVRARSAASTFSWCRVGLDRRFKLKVSKGAYVVSLRPSQMRMQVQWRLTKRRFPSQTVSSGAQVKF